MREEYEKELKQREEARANKLRKEYDEYMRSEARANRANAAPAPVPAAGGEAPQDEDEAWVEAFRGAFGAGQQEIPSEEEMKKQIEFYQEQTRQLRRS